MSLNFISRAAFWCCVLLSCSVNFYAQEKIPVTQGQLLAGGADGAPLGLCPLTRTEVKADITGFMARVTVTQEFTNPFPQPIEAVYTFPLPQDSAVDDMTMTVGPRVIRGQIMRREAARQVYEEAKARGQLAGLLDQERPNIFTQSVANIQPGWPVKVVISYVETLKYENGAYEFVFPMKVGPRYTPGAPDQAHASRLDETRSGQDISLEINIAAGVPIESITSATHAVDAFTINATHAQVRLRAAETIPNQDFIARYDVAGGRIADALLTHRADANQQGYFTFILQPPDRFVPADITPKEIIFVVDTSGSMQGFPFDKAKETASLALANLNPQDTFNLIAFSGDDHVLFPEPVPATPAYVQQAQQFLAGTRSGGGTEMMKAVRSALKPSRAPNHLRIVCFMTDGQVGNDMEIIAAVKQHANARVFAIGFGTSPNRFLLDKIAEYGRGAVEYVTDERDKDAAGLAKRFYERVRNPLLTDARIDWGGLPVADIYPNRLPDLFSAQPVIVSGRFTRGASGVLRLTGQTAGAPFTREIPVTLPEVQPEHDVLAKLWARRKIDALMGEDYNGLQYGNPKPEIKEAITKLGLSYRLLTQFTSFVAVEDNQVQAVKRPAAEDPARQDNFRNTSMPAGFAPAVAAGVAASVEVSVDSSDSRISSNISAQSIENLPMRARNFTSLLQLAPGVAPAPSGNRLDAGDAGQFTANGQRPDANQFTVDGVSANFGLTPGAHPGASLAGNTPALTSAGGTSALVTSEALAELDIKTYGLAPEYGRTPGAHINATTRAGTNEFHGTLFERFSHDRLDANDWFANQRGLPRATHRQNAFGGALGGPLRQNKSFFFFAYEGLRLRQPFSAITDVPSLAARNAAPSNVQPFLRAFPLPNGATRPDGFAEFAASYANPARHNALSLRLDQQFGNRLRIGGRYHFARSSATERGAGLASLNTLNRVANTTQSLSFNGSFSATSVTAYDWRVNFSRAKLRSTDTLDNFGGAVAPPASVLFAPNLPAGERGLYFDLNGRNAALSSATQLDSKQRQLHFLGTVTHIAGNHTLKFGADFRRLTPVAGGRAVEQLALFAGVNGALTGNAARLNTQFRAAAQRPSFLNFSAYGQDEWHATPAFRITYGARWEVHPAPALESVTGLAALNLNQTWRTTYGNIAPRVGVAWNITGNGTSVMRGGVSVFYDTGHAATGELATESEPFVGNVAVYNQPFTVTPQGGLSSAPRLVWAENLRLPRVWQWHGSYEQALGYQNSFSAAYVGLSGERLIAPETTFLAGPQTPFTRRYSNIGESSYHALQLQFTRRASNNLYVLAAYTLSSGRDNVPTDTAARIVLREDATAISDYDTRQALSSVVTYMIPKPFAQGLGFTLLRNWQLAGFFKARAARPLNVTYGIPTTYGWLLARPDTVANVPLYVAGANGPRRINPLAFSAPDVLRQGTAPRNGLRGFPLYQLDTALSRAFKFSDSNQLDVRLEAYNVLNRANFSDPAGFTANVGHRFAAGALTLNPLFGQSFAVAGRNLYGGPGRSFRAYYQDGGPRALQLTVKFRF